MSYVWEEEYYEPPRRIGKPQQFSIVQWHLKRVFKASHSNHDLKYSIAWITREAEHKYHLRIAKDVNNDKTFRSLKAAKAYATAVVTLDT